MAIREIRVVPDPVLRTPCDPIGTITPAVRRLVQDLLDSIIPGILPLAAVFGIYFYLSKGGQKYSALVWVLLIISILGSVLGVFA